MWNRPGVIRADSGSPQRVEFGSRPFVEGKGLRYRLAYRFRILPTLLRTGREARRGFSPLRWMPCRAATRAPEDLFVELEAFARAQGIDELGYTTLEPSLLFRGKAVLYRQVIVLVRQMDAEKLSLAPSFAALSMIHGTYLELGKATNRLADRLRAWGYGAQADSPLGGAALLPVLAMRAGLGAVGRHGLLITPRFGSRQRLAAVYTNIQNLPAADNACGPGAGPHAWVREYCDACGACLNLCPGQAILKEPLVLENGGLRHLDYTRCLPYFYALDGCSWCIKECPFNRVPYESLRREFREHKRLRLYGETSDTSTGVHFRRESNATGSGRAGVVRTAGSG